jgi:hypothetical protein
MIITSCEITTRKEVKIMKKVKYDYSRLCGRIREVYKTDGDFAQAMQIQPSSLSRKLRNLMEWKGTEIHCACNLLAIPLEEVPLYFFVVKL